VEKKNKMLAEQRSTEIKKATASPNGTQWSSYPQSDLKSPSSIEQTQK
jgi:hypothetical protein